MFSGTSIMIVAWAVIFCVMGQVNAAWQAEFAEGTSALDQELKSLKLMLQAFGRQMMMQQFFLEERARSGGHSGVKTVRLRTMGTKSYHTDSYSSFSTLSLHDHSNNVRTVGLGEFSAVLNGVDFTTRHNDYRLFMPHRTNTSYNMMEEIPFPEVPPSVLKETDLGKASEEMQEYFKAWRDQNKTHRDYTPYFKPVLCYLEGAWTNGGDTIEEPFFSDRHFIDAKNWIELQEKTRFSAYSGSKTRFENLAFLPTNIMGFVNESVPLFSQWNYRILCHPIQKEVPLNRFQVVDDLQVRVKNKRNIHDHKQSRGARFALSPVDGAYEDKPFNRGFLDELMEEIPGKDNYPGKLLDEGLDTEALEFDGVTKKDVSRYHRVFKIGGSDATGINTVNRGYNDDYMFAAMTTQPKVSGLTLKKPCTWAKNAEGKWIKTCPEVHQKWTYAIPLEIIYLTPLQKWNPFNLKYYGEDSSVEGAAIRADGRNGDCAGGAAKAFLGTNSKNFYQTPAAFFGDKNGGSSADTVRGQVCMLDPSGAVKETKATGVHVFLPSIANVGSLRTRYPIYPVYDEGSTIWKELESLKELVMDKENYAKYYWKASNEPETGDKTLEIGDSIWKLSTIPRHRHTFTLSLSDINSMKHGLKIDVQTSLQQGHEHTLTMRYNSDVNAYEVYKCDNNWNCFDGHPKTNLTLVSGAQP